ncbi:MAG: hypothetical protein ISS35_07180 [Kiritimatiellae bacterium]|nr:hypothetical protein [Kiritimatiellia bacterium]
MIVLIYPCVSVTLPQRCALDDQSLRAKAQRWVEAVLKSQRDTGDIGPRNQNWWANMIAQFFQIRQPDD